MKYLLGLILLTGFFSCNNTEPAQTTTTPPRPKLVPKDSPAARGDTTSPFVPVDVSPMDIAWLPQDYPKVIRRHPALIARVIYSRPHKQGRKIFGSLIKYGERWRLGANESTEIELFTSVNIQGKTVAKGRYILYCIPEPENWTIVFNSNLNSWGLNLDPSKDVHRFSIPSRTKPQSVEYFSMMFQSTATGADLVMAWDNVEARLPFQFKQK